MSIDTWLKISGMAASAVFTVLTVGCVFYYMARKTVDRVAALENVVTHKDDGVPRLAERARREEEKMDTIERIIFAEGEGLNIPTILYCKQCRDDCRKNAESSTDSKDALMWERIEQWSKSINALAEAMDKRFKVQEKRWKVVVKHIIRATALTELLSERETGLKLKGLENLIISDEDLGLDG